MKTNISHILQSMAAVVARLSTEKHGRESLEHVDALVLVCLSDALRGNGVGHKVAADMLGMKKRTYYDRMKRARANVERRRLTIWNSLLELLLERRQASRSLIIESFEASDLPLVKAALHEMVSRAIVYQTGNSDNVVYKVNEEAADVLRTARLPEPGSHINSTKGLQKTIDQLFPSSEGPVDFVKYTYELWSGHPMEAEVRDFIRSTQEDGDR